MVETVGKSAIPTIAEALGQALGPKCSRCARHPPGHTSLVAAIDYSYPGDMLIQRFKEGARLAYAGMFARLLWGRLQASASGGQGKVSFSALVPIPSSQSALKRRGFNPAAELARELARLSGLPVQHTWLTRTRETTTQKTLNARARRESVAGLYVCPSAVPGVWIGLVDDVITTGSTMDTAAQALLSAGAAGVVGLAAAHTPRAWQNGTYD
jgi:ComF family protein